MVKRFKVKGFYSEAEEIRKQNANKSLILAQRIVMWKEHD